MVWHELIHSHLSVLRFYSVYEEKKCYYPVAH